MDIVALIAWLLTATGGFVMLGIWINKGGHRAGGAGTRLAPGLVFGHFALAATGLVLWIIYLLANESVLAWIAFVLLLVVALIGFTMFARWLPVRNGDNAESRFPLGLVLGHGVLAATTLVVVFVAALNAA